MLVSSFPWGGLCLADSRQTDCSAVCILHWLYKYTTAVFILLLWYTTYANSITEIWCKFINNVDYKA